MINIDMDAIKSRLARVVRDGSGRPRRFDGQLVDDAARLVAEVERLRAEAVSVVRCRDCIHSEPIPLDKETGWYAERVLVCKNNRGDYDTSDGFSATWANGYCDEGKRKEAEGQKYG